MSGNYLHNFENEIGKNWRLDIWGVANSSNEKIRGVGTHGVMGQLGFFYGWPPKLLFHSNAPVGDQAF